MQRLIQESYQERSISQIDLDTQTVELLEKYLTECQETVEEVKTQHFTPLTVAQMISAQNNNINSLKANTAFNILNEDDQDKVLEILQDLQEQE